MNNVNISLVGVGGQGVVSTGIILGNTVARKGINVVMSEIHGMAQRGGIVTVDLRIGDVYGPIIPEGKIDLIIGFEALETIRALKRASRKTRIIMNTERIIPFTVNIGDEKYPDIEEIIKKFDIRNIIGIDAVNIAKQTGNLQSVNMVLLGAAFATELLPIEEKDIEESIKIQFPEYSWESNIKAFRIGMDQYRILTKAYL
ncbi:MAG: indolepyruvate oxidoreductase subunit beta [Thermoplasmata archaeon]|jgi:indolepyruvate ferredoxin oxidoreductase beta subunit|nr:indolepyruvate oxidoreductase subunit beta [Thermoplasmata archaeon]MVT14352.1 indolepyruvate ferredoxin oxidoreductase subunit beta [Euryarchaeota archaeon]MVT35358.1 indolepyruvate ferredoxin oxidoreductase subunit beta [Euryarchaeota archaeon]